MLDITMGQDVRVDNNIDIKVRRLVQLAVDGLMPMFDRQSGLFCHKLKRTTQGLVQEGTSRRYTVITLMGLHRLEATGILSPIETRPVLQKLLVDIGWVDNIGDLGLLLWLCALTCPERLAELESRLEIAGALTRYRDARKGRTMELAWFLSGLCHWGLACPEKLAGLKDLAFETCRMMMNNYGGLGTFGHLGRANSMSGRIRGWVGSFADQVYPIYALTKLWEAYGSDTAAKHALDCAHAICQAQGPLGQWWWHYDSSTGQVADGYPVFSVHQHGMAPMTLFALGEATQTDFDPWIYKGLSWINGNNELGFDVEDTTANLIWRCIYRPFFPRYWDAAFHRDKKPIQVGPRDRVRVLYECRPYELGWLLYAFSARCSRVAQVQEGYLVKPGLS